MNSFISSPPSTLTYLYKRFVNANGKIVRHKVTSLDDPLLVGYDVIVNCLGLGAREVVPDEKVFPIRGQLVRVSAPWLYQSVFDETTEHYIIPNQNYCVLGGTHQDYDYNTNIDDKDRIFIMNGCQAVIPGLKNAEIIKHWAGLRPARHEVRIEAELRNGKIVIHNYGHGGSGFTLFWGCGSEVLRLFEETVMNNKSKL